MHFPCSTYLNRRTFPGVIFLAPSPSVLRAPVVVLDALVEEFQVALAALSRCCGVCPASGVEAGGRLDLPGTKISEAPMRPMSAVTSRVEWLLKVAGFGIVPKGFFACLPCCF